MKIALFTDAFLDLTGGVITSVGNLKVELERQGHTVYLFSTGFRRSEAEKKRLQKQHIFVVPSCFWCFRGLTPVSRRPGIIEKWLKKNFVELKDFDIFHIHYEGGCSIAGLRLGKEWHIPTVQTMHGREDVGVKSIAPLGLRSFVAGGLNWFHSWYLPHPQKVKKDDKYAYDFPSRKMWELMVNHANAADLVLTPTDHFRRKLIHYGVKRDTQVLANGFLDEKFPNDVDVKVLKPGETLRIVWHCRLMPEKRLMVFLEALKNVNGKYRLDVFGDGPDYRKAAKMIKKYQMPIALHGSKPFSEVEKYIRKAHLDVLVSYNYDTFGMTLIEAAAYGVPSLVCDLDMREVLSEDRLFICDGLDASAIERGIQAILDQPSQIEEVSRKLLDSRYDFAQSRRAAESVKIYETLRRKA